MASTREVKEFSHDIELINKNRDKEKNVIETLLANINDEEKKIKELNAIVEELCANNTEIQSTIEKERFPEMKMVEQTKRIRETCKALIEPINSIGTTIKVTRLKENEIGCVTDEIQTLTIERKHMIEEKIEINQTRRSAMVKKFHQDISKFNKEIEAKNKKHEQMLKTIEDLQLRYDEKATILEKKKNVQNITEKTDELNVEIDVLKKKGHDKNATIVSVKKEMEEFKSRFENNMNDLNFELDEENEKLRLINDALLAVQKSYNDHKNYNESSEQIDRAYKDLEMLTQTYSENKGALSKTEEMFALNKERVNKELQNLNDTKEQRDGIRNQLTNKNAHFRKQLEKLLEDVDACVASNNVTFTQIRELQEILNRDDGELLDVTSKNQLRSNIESEEKQIAATNLEMQYLEKKMTENENDLRNDINQMETSLSETKIQYESNVNNLEQEMILMKKTSNENIEEIKQEFSEEKTKLEAEIEALKIEYRKIEETFINIHTKFRALRTTNHDLYAQNDNLEKQCNLLQNNKDNIKRPDSSTRRKRGKDNDEASVSSTEGITLVKLHEMNRLRRLRKRL